MTNATQTSEYRVGDKAVIKGTPAFAGWPGVPDELVTVVKPRAESLPMPGPDWLIVRAANGGRMCFHVSRLVKVLL